MAASTNGNGQSEESQSATRLEFFAPAGGLRVDGKTYREGDRIPAKYGRAIASGETPKDPAWNSALAPPNLGRTVIPNIYTYASRQSLIAKIYRNPDEAMRHSVTNARAMTRDLVVWGCIEARQRGTVLLDWHLETEDKNDPQQKQLVEELTRIVSATPGFTEYRRNLMDAIWYGRAGIQHEYGFQHRTGKRYTVLKGWKPINGDKLLFRYDDGSGRYDPDQVGIKTSFVHPAFDAPAGNRVVETTDQGAGYFLEKWERSLWAIHKHTIEDGLHEDILSAGRVHGVGIRDRIYWQWFQRQNALAMLMELVERTGNGFTVYYYQYGNPEAKAAMTDIAKNHGYNNNILIPRMAGDPSMDANGIEVIPANVGGIDALKELIDGFFDEQTVRYILGQTLTTRASSTGLGSGLADLHQESFIQIVKYDARKLEETITNELIEPLKKFNFPWAREIPVYFRIDTEGTEPEQKLAAVKSGWEMGLKIKSDDVYGMLGISKPTEEDEVLENPQLAQAAAQVMHETRLGQGADDGGGDDGQGYDPQNLEHLFGPALKAAGVDSQPSDNGDDQQQPTRFARARYAVTHAPEGGSSGGGKEYKGGQFQPQDAAAKGKQADPNAAAKPVKATATQAAREAGMLKHGFIDQPITDADRGQLWAMARANLGNDSSLPPEMRGMFVTLQMMKETQQMGVVTTDKIDPKIAQGIYQWMQSNAGQDAGGGHVRDLGNGKLGFSAKSGALILAPAGGGKFNATYTPMTHVVRSAGDVGGKAPDQQAFDFANQEQGDGFGPELGAEEMQIESDPVADDYGQELGPDEMQIEDIDGDAIEAEANGVEPDGQRGQSSSREPGDDSDEDADPDDSGFGPQPKTSGPTAQSKSLSKRSEIGKSIMAAAAEYGVDEDELNKAVEHIWNMHREAHAQHEEAMTAVRKWFGYTQRDIHRWENQGKDYSSIKGFDVIAREVAKAYPELGLGKGRDDTKEDEGLDEALWNALKEGKRTLPTRQEVVGEAAEWLSRSKREREREQRRQREELAAVPFKKRLTEYFVAKYGGKKFKPAAGQGGFDFDAPAPKPAAASTSASTSSGPLTDANGHLHAPKGGATVNGKDFEGGEYIPPGDIAAASDEEKADLQAKQSAAIGESLKKATGSTNLFGDEVRDKPKPATFENAKGKQGKMFSGMDALPGQGDLFEDMDNVNARDEDEPAAEEPAAQEPHELHPDKFLKSSDMHQELRDAYFDKNTPKFPGQGSRQVPAKVTQHPLGSWRIDDFKGIHGRDIEQLREFDPDELDTSENMVETNEQGRGWDAERYADWMKEGHEPPPIHVVETDSGQFRVTDGHRRRAAAKLAGKKVRAWVSPSANVPGATTPDGKPIKTGLTHELAVRQALEAGAKVPDDVLREYPGIHKETVRKDEKQGEMFDDAEPEVDAPPVQEISGDEELPEADERTETPASKSHGFESDIPRSLAIQAHSGTSHVPEKRAESVIREYASSLQNDYDQLSKLADSDEKKELLEAEFARYREGYKSRTKDYLAAKSRVMSSMITGPARFPVASNQKKSDTADKRYSELADFQKRAMAAMRKKLNPESGPIMASDPKAVESLSSLIEKAEKKQEHMRTVNATIRKLKSKGKDAQLSALKDLGIHETIASKLLEPDFAGRIGYADYELTNNNANIKRMKARVTGIERNQSTEASEKQGKNARFEDAPSDNRVRLYFPGKPSDEVRAKLKSRGFRWSPTIGAWQAYRNPGAIQAAKSLAGLEE